MYESRLKLWLDAEHSMERQEIWILGLNGSTIKPIILDKLHPLYVSVYPSHTYGEGDRNPALSEPIKIIELKKIFQQFWKKMSHNNKIMY